MGNWGKAFSRVVSSHYEACCRFLTDLTCPSGPGSTMLLEPSPWEDGWSPAWLAWLAAAGRRHIGRVKLPVPSPQGWCWRSGHPPQCGWERPHERSQSLPSYCNSIRPRRSRPGGGQTPLRNVMAPGSVFHPTPCLFQSMYTNNVPCVFMNSMDVS